MGCWTGNRLSRFEGVSSRGVISAGRFRKEAGSTISGFKRPRNDAFLEPEIGCLLVVEVEAGGGDDGFAEKLVTGVE
jgi:hypothetical protein